MSAVDLSRIDRDMRERMEVFAGYFETSDLAAICRFGSGSLEGWGVTSDDHGLLVIQGWMRETSGPGRPHVGRLVGVSCKHRLALDDRATWLGLGAHLTDTDSDSVRSILVAAAARCDELRAALLAPDGEEDLG